MNGRRVTDDQISQALRAHVPQHIQAGLRDRILERAETTTQQRALPSVLGALSEADPVIRRRNLLIAAAFLVALALASAAAVGAWRQQHPDPIPKLLLDHPADVQAYAFSSVERLPQLPPVAITVLNDDATTDRIYVDQSGAVRLERYASADATKPLKTLLLNGNSVSGTVSVAGNPVWLEQDDAISDDPRRFLGTISSLTFVGSPGCEMTQDEAAKDGTATTSWQYVDAELVAGRPTQHLACGGSDLWLDDATRLILRVRQPNTDDAGAPIPGSFKTTEVTKMDFGAQPAALFAFDPPSGATAMSLDTYRTLCPGDTIAFLDYAPCAGTGAAAAEAPTPTPEPTPVPTPTPRPDPGDCPIPSRTSASAGPLVWSQASVRQDWPAPVRTEPAGAPTVMPMPPTYIDPAGDTGADPFRCVDIRDVTAGTYTLSVHLVARPPSGVDPSKARIAYGVVVDEDGDGVPDWRYGIDNMADKAGEQQHIHRAWRTNLHTGQTEWDPGRIDHPIHGEDGASVGSTFFATSYPAAAKPTEPGFRFGGHSDVAGVGTVTYGNKFVKPFYVWASMIVNGRVVATDYAPDTGWLLSSPGTPQAGTNVIEGIEGAPLRITLSTPEGWDGLTRDGGNAGLEVMSIDKPATDACDKPGHYREATIGPGVDDLVTFLGGLKTVKIAETTDVTIGGFRGRYVEYTVTIPDDNCGPTGWPATSPTNEGRWDKADWILDVDGIRLVIEGVWSHERSATVLPELRQIVDSIQIGP